MTRCYDVPSTWMIGDIDTLKCTDLDEAEVLTVESVHRDEYCDGFEPKEESNPRNIVDSFVVKDTFIALCADNTLWTLFIDNPETMHKPGMHAPTWYQLPSIPEPKKEPESCENCTCDKEETDV